MAVAGSLIMLFLKPPPILDIIGEVEKEHKVDPITDIKNTFKYLTMPRMLHCQPAIIFTGFSAAIMGSIFVNLITRAMSNTDLVFGHDVRHDKNKQDSYACYTYTLLGAGEMSGGQIIGLIRDKVNFKTALIFQIVMTISGFGCILVFN